MRDIERIVPGEILGVRSTNNAPFKLYAGEPASGLDTGCSKPEPAPPGCGAIVHGIRFDYDSADIRPESEPILDNLYKGLSNTPDAKMVIVGHTSSEGSDAYNRDLSERRALSVVAALTGRGLEPGRLMAEGKGEEQPIADNATEAGRSLNRWVESVCR